MAASNWGTINTNYGPLTTTFTPLSTCLSWLHAKTLDRGGYFYDALGGADGPCSKSGNGRPDAYAYHYNDDCYPSTLAIASIGFFSPGTVCPSAWTEAATTTVSSGLTEAYCCPRYIYFVWCSPLSATETDPDSITVSFLTSRWGIVF